MTLLTKQELLDFLQTADLKLKPRQTKLSLPIIQRIHFKMQLNVSLPNILVDDDLIVNGHHRYICSQLLNKHIGIDQWIKPDGARRMEWHEILVDDADYDTKEQILAHNKRDAAYSGVDIEVFNRLILEKND